MEGDLKNANSGHNVSPFQTSKLVLAQLWDINKLMLMMMNLRVGVLHPPVLEGVVRLFADNILGAETESRLEARV